jgi:hypothetical protein
MGFEWQLISAQSITGSARQALFAGFEEKKVYVLKHRSSPAEVTGNYSLTDTAHRRGEWPEDFTLSVIAQQVYLCIHTATGPQREAIIRLLKDCLHQAGIAGEFEEI